MTSAHRPTWASALGGTGLREGAASAPTYQHSSRDLAAHTKLKLRQPGQDGSEALSIKEHYLRRKSEQKRQLSDEDEKAIVDECDQAEFSKQDDELSSETFTDQEGDKDQDSDEDNDEDGDDKDQNSDQDSEASDEDDTEALMRELEKIKRERAAEKEAAILSRNPLLADQLARGNKAAAGAGELPSLVKRRWTDDTVFKHQTRGVEENPGKRFVNDTTRSDFHRNFLHRYVR